MTSACASNAQLVTWCMRPHLMYETSPDVWDLTWQIWAKLLLIHHLICISSKLKRNISRFSDISMCQECSSVSASVRSISVFAFELELIWHFWFRYFSQLWNRDHLNISSVSQFSVLAKVKRGWYLINVPHPHQCHPQVWPLYATSIAFLSTSCSQSITPISLLYLWCEHNAALALHRIAF